MMKKSQPKPKVSGMYDFQNIYTGDPKKSPGVVKAKADRAKSDSAVSAYKKKSDTSKSKAIAVAKMKKK
jgi:hypothetical protein